MSLVPIDFISDAPVTWALVLGTLPFLLLWWRRRKGRKPRPLPVDGIWDLELLKHFDGRENPLCLAVCGKVVDVSSSENIRYGEGYGKLWAGCDATWALATLSLNSQDANKLDWKLSDLTKDQHKALAGWYKHFTTKYQVVGTLKEYDGWDFSSVEEESKSQTPFGLPATQAKPSPSAQEKAQEAVVFAKGDKVKLKGVQDMPELEGKEGVLQTYDAEKKGFAVQVDDEGESKVVVLRPSQLEKLKAG